MLSRKLKGNGFGSLTVILKHICTAVLRSCQMWSLIGESFIIITLDYFKALFGHGMLQSGGGVGGKKRHISALTGKVDGVSSSENSHSTRCRR